MHKKGFTLIELMVVISIIGILMAVIIPNLGNSRAASRDAKRIADIKNIEIALKMYYADKAATYPIDLSAELVPNYLPNLPKDPRGTDYVYAALGGATCTSFHLGALLETAHTALYDDADASHTGTGNTVCNLFSGSNFNGLSYGAVGNGCTGAAGTAVTSATPNGTERCYDIKP